MNTITSSSFRRQVFALLFVAASIFAGRAATPSAPSASQTDSLARAVATYWGTAVNTARLSPDARRAFVGGFRDNFGSADSLRTEYLRGGLMAVSIAASLDGLREMGLEISDSLVVKFMSDVLMGGNVGFTAQTAQRYIDAQIDPITAAEFSPERQAAYLDEAAAREGAVRTPDGLVFEVITEGEGPSPMSGQDVMVKYTGRLSDGTVFDQTKEPISLGVDRVVPGFSEGLKMMKPGGTYRITIPASLAYGDTGAGGVIPPGATIDFTVELVEVK